MSKLHYEDNALTKSNLILNCRGRLLDLSTPLVMGILNITPDSFYQNSRLKTTEQVLKQAEQMLQEGATFLDIGGASSRPNAEVVSVDEELQRVLPMIELIAKYFPEAFLSIDTYQSEVAQESISAGIHLVNDISASSIDERLLDVVAAAKIPYVLMHMQGTPQTMQEKPVYNDVLVDVLDYFINKIALLKEKGIEDVVLDVGFGFGKTIEHNYDLLSNLHVFQTLEKPMLVGVSRKSMIWKVLNSTPNEALNGTTALHLVALQQGAKILRVHDVKAATETIKLWQLVEHSTRM